MKYIKGFDGLRGISILMVITTHLGSYYFLPADSFFRDRLWLLFSGSTGVQIFFTLSGFLITKILLHEKNTYDKINFKNFYVRRFLRLLPPLIVFYLVVGVLMYFRAIHTTSIGFIMSFFYLYNFVPNIYYTGELGHTWSLALEEQFYLTWPFVIAFLKTKIRFFLIGILVFTCMVALYVIPQLEIAKKFHWHYWFIPAIAPIVIGAFFALILFRNKNQLQEFKAKNLFLILTVVLFLFPLYSPQVILRLNPIFQSIAISILLLYIVLWQQTQLVKLLNNSILSYVGKISYGLYVYQGLFLRTGPGGKLWIQYFPINLILTVLVSILSYELLEKRVLKLKRNFSTVKQKNN